MNILITGGTGFVGKHLTKSLIMKGHHVYILTRSPEMHTNSSKITYLHYDGAVDQLPTIYAVINLAGESLFGYWTKEKKAAILSSRINTTKMIVNLMRQMKVKPTVFISGSAIGFYGTSEEIIFTEKTTTAGDDFLAHVVLQWENTAMEAERLDIRTIYARFGVILGDEGALPLMRLPVKLFAGGRIGNGEQWTSWVHIDDVVNLLIFCIVNQQTKGPLNVTSPNPMRNKEFTKTLAKVLKRPHWLPTPSLFIRLAMGEMSDLITKGQYVLPQKSLDHNFDFLYTNLEDSLRDIHS